MALTNAIYKIRKSFWFLPAFYSVLAIALSMLSITIDSRVSQDLLEAWIPTFILTDTDLGRTILSALATSILTMTTITFSSILVVLTTYSSQFSPRTLQNFINQQKTQRVLGIFIGSFIFSILVLLFLKETHQAELFISPAVAVLIMIICLIYFVYLVHYVATSVQVSNLINQITSNTINVIEKNYAQDTGTTLSDEAPWDGWESEEIKQQRPKSVIANKTGYIQIIDIKGLVSTAKQYDSIVKLERYIGEYILDGTTLLSYWQFKDTEVNEANYLNKITVGIERTTTQDINFGLQKLIEIALRALSPGINDPNTAIICIKELGKILTYLGKKDMPSPYYFDSDSNLRVIIDHQDFSNFLYMSFYQIRQYGHQDISVVRAIIDALHMIAENNEKEIKDIVWEFSSYIMDGFDKTVLQDLDIELLEEKRNSLAKVAGHARHEDPYTQVERDDQVQNNDIKK